MLRTIIRRAGPIVVAGALIQTVAMTAATPASATLPGTNAALTRAPYLTDLTATSVQVSWATSAQNTGVVQVGTPGNCTATSVTAARAGVAITVNSVKEYQQSVSVTGLSPGTAYCYRITTGGASPIDLLGSGASPQFTTLQPAAGTAPFTFDVMGDWGDTTNSGTNNGSLNANQAGVDARIASSGAQFIVSAGDTAYPGGTQTEYGDLNQTGTNISAVFGPSYWAVPGETIPYYAASGNHGLNSTFLSEWPESAVASTGVYAMTPYPSVDGAAAGSYPTSYYAFSTGGVRFYVLDAAWGDGNVGTATGGACGSHCAIYQVDHDAHWAPTSAEYQWLAQDLAAHPGGLKMAAFHFPLRSDDATEPNDAYLDNTPGSTGTLEQLLHDNGVQLVFNGHAHDYQRNVAPPGGVTSYVTGGGGASASVVSHCSTTDAYAVGWSYGSKTGSQCGAAPKPTSDSQVYSFLTVAVNGTSVTVTPTDSQGRTFDIQTYNFAADTTPPSAPGGLTAKPGSTKNVLTWSAATDNIGVSAYDVYRNGTYLATTAPSALTYTDSTAVSGTGYTYQVAARDLAGNTTSATVLVNGGSSDTTPPSAPTALTATATGQTSVSLSWGAATGNIGVTRYTILRGGTAVGTVAAGTTSYSDTGLTSGTQYTYQVTASDAAGNVSQPSNQAAVTTQADTTPPTAPGTPVVSSLTSAQVGLTWTTSTDDVGVAGYRVTRNGSVIATVTGGSYTDTSVSPGTSYTYAITAYDAAGNSATSGTLAVTTPTSLFSDGFETGDLSKWTTVSGLTVSSLAHAGSFAARETSTGTATYAYKSLPGSYTELWAQAWVQVVSHTTSVNLLGFRTSGGGSIVNVYVDTTGRVSLRNNVGLVTTYGTTIMPAGSWHLITLHAIVSGTSSSVDVSMDGTAVPGLTLSGQNFGTSPIAKLQLGETSTGRTYDVALDDVTVAQSSP
jgi:chitodextrinase